MRQKFKEEEGMTTQKMNSTSHKYACGGVCGGAGWAMSMSVLWLAVVFWGVVYPPLAHAQIPIITRDQNTPGNKPTDPAVTWTYSKNGALCSLNLITGEICYGSGGSGGATIPSIPTDHLIAGGGSANTASDSGVSTNVLVYRNIANTIPSGGGIGTAGTGYILATDTSKVNGAAVPASQPCVGTNSGSQFITATCGGGISAVNAQTGTTYTFANTDCTKAVTFNNSSSIAATLPQAGAGGNFVAGCGIQIINLGVGTLTVTPTTSTINLASTFTLTTGQGALLISDAASGTGNYSAQTGKGGTGGTYTADGVTINLAGSQFSANTGPGGLETRVTGPSGMDTTCVANTGSTTAYHGAMLGKALAAYAEGMRFLLNSDVANAAGAVTVDCGPGPLRVYRYDGSTDPLAAQIGAIGQTLLSYSLSMNGGVGGFRILSGPTGSYTGAQTISSGSAAMHTSAIAGGACDASPLVVTASGVLSTDRVTFSANGSIKAVTGYTPGGGISINAYAGAGTVTFDQCNVLASGSTTPGAITVNWGVIR